MGAVQRSDPASPGWGRRRAGRGFVYLDTRRRPLRARANVRRCRQLVIPPDWTEVWICPDADGHIRATGTDAAGRRQYLYHPVWRAAREAEKYEHVLEVAARLPSARRKVRSDLARPGMPRERSCAVAFTLLDLGLFRIGAEEYEQEHGSFGLTTLKKHHLRLTRDRVAVFDYPAKSAQRRHLELSSDELWEPLGRLRRRRSGGSRLLAYCEQGAWAPLPAAAVAAYLKALLGPEASAKDFRTWHATVLAAVTLAASGPADDESAVREHVSRTIAEVAEQLGNTPAISRDSYIDPRVVETYEREGDLELPVPPLASPDEASERAVRELLEDG